MILYCTSYLDFDYVVDQTRLATRKVDLLYFVRYPVAKMNGVQLPCSRDVIRNMCFLVQIRKCAFVKVLVTL